MLTEHPLRLSSLGWEVDGIPAAQVRARHFDELLDTLRQRVGVD